jgi:hypothetical protein
MALTTLAGIISECTASPSDPSAIAVVKNAVCAGCSLERQRLEPPPGDTSTDSPSTAEILSRLTEELTVSLLHHPDVLPHQNVYRKLRDCLPRLHVQIQSKVSNERISTKVARALYQSDATDLQLALDNITVFVQLGTSNQTSTTTLTSTSASSQGRSLHGFCSL